MGKTIPLVPDPDYTPPADDGFTSACGDREPFALMVLGDIMEPEFEEGAVIVCDPGHPLFDGAYVVIEYADDYWFRQYVEQGERKLLKPLNPQHPDIELTGPFIVKGVVWQKNYQRKVTRYL